ncbi:MAG: mechanosensitive ion channel [Gammaproteobacteria bacterium]|nr:mechanosensitive ion channel [Gammaproteobacteria bacterium]
MNQFLEFLENTDWTTLAVDWGAKIAVALLIFVIGRWIAKFLGKTTGKLITKAGVDQTLAGFLGTLANVAITVFAAIAAVNHLGVATTSLVAIVGAAGLAVGLALKDSLANFAAGVMIMLFKPFRVGDFIQAGGVTGTVMEIGMVNIHFKTTDNQLVIAPNSSIMGDVITNYTMNPTRRINETIGISYDDDPAKAREIVLGIIQGDERFHDDPAPFVWVNEFGDNSVNLVVRAWTNTDIYWEVRADLLERIKRAFDEQGISIPFPQRDVHHYYTDGRDANASD